MNVVALIVALLVAANTDAALAQNYPASGRDLAATCASCHDTARESTGDIPSLAGRSKVELINKMQAFKDGAAPATIMPQLAKGYSDLQIELLADWLAAQKAGAK